MKGLKLNSLIVGLVCVVTGVLLLLTSATPIGEFRGLPFVVLAALGIAFMIPGFRILYLGLRVPHIQANDSQITIVWRIGGKSVSTTKIRYDDVIDTVDGYGGEAFLVYNQRGKMKSIELPTAHQERRRIMDKLVAKMSSGEGRNSLRERRMATPNILTTEGVVSRDIRKGKTYRRKMLFRAFPSFLVATFILFFAYWALTLGTARAITAFIFALAFASLAIYLGVWHILKALTETTIMVRDEGFWIIKSLRGRAIWKGYVAYAIVRHVVFTEKGTIVIWYKIPKKSKPKWVELLNDEIPGGDFFDQLERRGISPTKEWFF